MQIVTMLVTVTQGKKYSYFIRSLIILRNFKYKKIDLFQFTVNNQSKDLLQVRILRKMIYIFNDRGLVQI